MQTQRPLQLALLIGILSTGIGIGRVVPNGASSPLDEATNLSVAFREVSGRVAPAVVSVRAYADSRFGPRRRAQGSGVVIRRDGLVVTNNHVVTGSDEVRVHFSDGRELVAELVGTDSETDLAVLRLDGARFDHAPLRADGSPEVGEWVMAMGNPLGLGQTLTVGVVSGKGRTDLGIATYEDFIQTDAAINTGNSGGPLLDLEGRVIGINTAMGTASSNLGIGFAIPSDMVEKVVDGILSGGGRVRRGWLGVSMRDLTDGEADDMGYGGTSRVFIEQVIAGTPADRSDIDAGDIVLSVHGERVRSRQDMLNTIADIAPGTKVEIEVWRRGKNRTVSVTLGDRGRRDAE